MKKRPLPNPVVYDHYEEFQTNWIKKAYEFIKRLLKRQHDSDNNSDIHTRRTSFRVSTTKSKSRQPRKEVR